MSLIGRAAITMLKDYYRDGPGDFANIWAIEAYLRSNKIKNVTVPKAQGWDRQARLELADEKVATTYPGRRTGFRRLAQPTSLERKESRFTRIKDTDTRIRNDQREAEAAAAQADATDREIAVVALQQSMMQISATVVRLTS